MPEARANRHIPEHWFLGKEQKTTKKRKEQQEEQKTTKKRKEKQLGDEGEGEAAFGTASQLQNMVQP
eukprot:14734654-Heterocapsa_arctica.AAC.1